MDPANLIYSHCESPYFDDFYYIGEIKNFPFNELKTQFPNLSNASGLNDTTDKCFLR